MTILKTNTLQHTNATTSFTIGTNGKVTWNTLSGTYNRVAPATNTWQGTVSSEYNSTFPITTLFPSVPLTASAMHCSATAFNSSRNDHVNHLIGGSIVNDGGISWDATDATRRRGSFMIMHNGDSGNTNYFGNSETGIITPVGGSITMCLANGYNTGTHYVVITCYAYWI